MKRKAKRDKAWEMRERNGSTRSCQGKKVGGKRRNRKKARDGKRTSEWMEVTERGQKGNGYGQIMEGKSTAGKGMGR